MKTATNVRLGGAEKTAMCHRRLRQLQTLAVWR
eukprot:COSAG05_NODE_29038_length_113_cov_125.571429_1_plen_32_part_01